MLVLQIIADGKLGGGATYLLQLLKGLQGAISFRLITEKNSYLLKEATALGISCVGLRFFWGRFNPFTLWSLKKRLRIMRPDLVHIHGGRAGLFFALCLSKIPMIYTVHGFHFVGKSPIYCWLALKAERLIVRRASFVIFVSSYDAKLAKQNKILSENTPYAVVYPGISLAELPSVSPQASCHIGFVGRLEHQKDPLLFLEMMTYLPGYSASIVGGGKLENTVKEEIKRKKLERQVRMLGPLPRDETLNVLATLSAVVVTSRWEGLPLLILEAMAIGVPVVSTQVSGIGEVVQSWFNGLLVKDRCPEVLAKNVQMVTKNKGLLSFIGLNAQSTILGQFSIEKMLSSILDIYQAHSNLKY